jgi:hypothetical protein
MAYVLQSNENPLVYKVAGSACHDRFCLPCATDRARSAAANILEFTDGKQLRSLELTLKHSEAPLSEQLDKLYTSFQALRRRSFWSKRVRGGIAFLELTYNAETKAWHPHFHMLLEGLFLPVQGLKKLWYEITTDSFVVYIRAVRDTRSAARYATKYASKPFNNTFLNRPDALDEAVVALKGRKLFFTFGSFRGLLCRQPVTEEGWSYIAPRSELIQQAATGDDDARTILSRLTDADLGLIYAKAPRDPPPPTPLPKDYRQLNFFGAWQGDGCYF